MLNSWTQGAVHAVTPALNIGDPDDTANWSSIGECAGLNVEVLDQKSFYSWTKHFYTPISCYWKLDEKDCYHGPHKGKW